MRLRTTLRLEESLLMQAKILAAKQNKTLTALIQEGLCKVIKEAQTAKPGRKVAIPISKQSGGIWPGIDISNSAELLDIMDGYLLADVNILANLLLQMRIR
jgi:hypothetical protein